jgi:hypothetical protein
MNRERLLSEHKVLKGNYTHIEVKISYDIGGMNYFQGCTMPRGIYLTVSAVSKSKGWRSQKAFSGTTTLIKPLNRFSQKAFDNFNPKNEDVKKVFNDVLSKNNITLVEGENPFIYKA